MVSVIGLGENNDLTDWFIPEEKRAELPLEKSTGTFILLAIYY